MPLPSHAPSASLLAPARRIIPQLGGPDIPPMLVLIALQVLRPVLVRSKASSRRLEPLSGGRPCPRRKETTASRSLARP